MAELAGIAMAITATTAKKGMTRIGDKLFLFTGHNSLRRRPGNGSQIPWIVQLSLTTNAAATMTAAIGSTGRVQLNQRRSCRQGKPSAAPAVKTNCQARGLKYQTWPSG